MVNKAGSLKKKKRINQAKEKKKNQTIATHKVELFLNKWIQ